uniref:LIM zinc-binding domain-containing protein n=1 Tax=Romanomermis culicivorax TaxID=13658 RepID=A0A915JRR2_ROMCU
MSDKSSTITPTFCSRCRLPVHAQHVKLSDQVLHIQCFNCEVCGINLIGGFHKDEEQFYCTKCYRRLIPVCQTCQKPIGCQLDGTVDTEEKFFKAFDSKYHPQCFSCKQCKRPLPGGLYYESDKQPYCLEDYWCSKTSENRKIIENEMKPIPPRVPIVTKKVAHVSKVLS